MTEWSQRATAYDQLTFAEDTKDGTVLKGRNFIVKSPDAAASKLDKRGSVQLVFHFDGDFTAESKIDLRKLFPVDSKAMPLLITRATVVGVLSSKDQAGLVRACLKNNDRAIQPELKQQIIGEDPSCALLALGNSTAAVTWNADTLLAEATDDVIVEQVAALSTTELQAEIKRNLFEVTTSERKSTVTDFVRVVLPNEPGAQPANALQFIVFSCWSDLAAKTFTALADKSFKDQWVVPRNGSEPASVLVHEPALQQAITATLKQGGRGSLIIDGSRGLSLKLSRAVEVDIAVQLEYALFASPESIQLDPPVAQAHAVASVAPRSYSRFGRKGLN